MDDAFIKRLTELAIEREIQTFITTSNGFKELIKQKRYRDNPILFVEQLQRLAFNSLASNNPKLIRKLHRNKATIESIFASLYFSQEMLTPECVFKLAWLDNQTNLILLNDSLNDAITIKKMLM